MSEQVVTEFVIGFIVGAAICLGKEYLMQRFFLTGNMLISAILFFGRLVVDVCVMIVAARISMPALLGVATGLAIYVNILLIKTFKEEVSSTRKR